MASTPRRKTAYAKHALLFLAMATTTFGQGALVPKGCYSSSQPLEKKNTYTWQSSGWCQVHVCALINKPVIAVSNGNECYCGDEVPDESSKVDGSKCNTPCDGYDVEMCGGDGYFQVYSYAVDPGDDGPNADGTSGGTATVTSATPSVVTHVSPGKTVVVTEVPSGAASEQSSGDGGRPNPTAVAAGVVVAVVVLSGVLLGLFFYFRHRRRQAADEEYKRNQLSDFIRGGEPKPPQTGYSSMSDSRLDPEFGNKRNSTGSIADNEDFSRKILRVANPDRS